MDKQYIEFFNQVLAYRSKGLIRHRDITTLVALMEFIDFENYNDIKNKRLVNKTDMDKSDISKSVKSLIKMGIVIKCENGYKLNGNLDII